MVFKTRICFVSIAGSPLWLLLLLLLLLLLPPPPLLLLWLLLLRLRLRCRFRSFVICDAEAGHQNMPHTFRHAQPSMLNCPIEDNSHANVRMDREQRLMRSGIVLRLRPKGLRKSTSLF
jgi:hypothetical protein